MEPATTEKVMADLRAVVRDAEALLGAVAAESGERLEGASESARDRVSAGGSRLRMKANAIPPSAAPTIKASPKSISNPWTSRARNGAARNSSTNSPANPATRSNSTLCTAVVIGTLARTIRQIRIASPPTNEINV